MTPEEFARVKLLFNEAILLPEQQRVNFVQQAAVSNSEICQEVLSLLKHHSQSTILASSNRRETPTFAAAAATVSHAATVDLDKHLVMRDVWRENVQILRQRLLIITVVVGMLVVFSLSRLLWYGHIAQHLEIRLVAGAILLACAILLYRQRDVTVVQLRSIEFLVLVVTVALVGVLTVPMMVNLASLKDVPTLISVNNWNYFITALVIFVYGVFMPNSWRRAAAVVLPLAFVPTCEVGLANLLNPDVMRLLDQDRFGRPVPAPLLAAGISIYAAHLIHDARLSAFRARQMAQYRLHRLIGQGGMGQVYEAEHMMMKRACAIKIIQPERLPESLSLARFEEEVRATANLTHPHTIEVFDYGVTRENVYFYVMEFLPGMNLGELVSRTGSLPPARAIHFLVETCEALEEAHAAGFIHRDIKPANIFASQRGGIYDYTKLLDFGLVQRRLVDLPSSDLRAGQIAGTPDYMAPEQITEPSKVDVRSDIYSLGAVAYFLLTGRPPFVSETPVSVMLAHLHQAPEPPVKINDRLPRDLNDVIMRCLEKDVQQRFSTCRSLREALLQCEAAKQWSRNDASEWWQLHDRVHPSTDT